WHWALGADGGHGHAQPPFRSSRLIGAERQPTSDCRQSLQQSLKYEYHYILSGDTKNFRHIALVEANHFKQFKKLVNLYQDR
ncbi:hypothetical protein U9884_21600, partial [Escherichia coli]